MTSGFYAWSARTVCAVGHSPRPHPASPLSPYISEVAAVRSDAEDFVEVCIDHDTTGKKLAVSDFLLQSYAREELWLSIFQVDDVGNPLRAVSQTPDEKLMEPLRTKSKST